MRIPLINRFTCSENQLPKMINLIKEKKMIPILDYTNENLSNHKKNFKQIKKLINNHPNNLIAVKLSSLNLNENYLHDLTNLAIQQNSKLLIDAENFKIQESINKISDNFMQEYNQNDLVIYKTYQMYRKDSFDILKKDLSKDRNYSIGVKLVRGAYYNEDYCHKILFDNISETHHNYDQGIFFFKNNFKPNDKLLCATHNENSINLATKIIKNNNLNNIEFAQLLGMSENLSNNLSKNYTVYKYLPYGNFSDTLPYLIRRLYENYPMVFNLFK